MFSASHAQRHRTGHAAAEARTVFLLVQRNRETIDSARELIAVPPRIQEALRRFASRYPDQKRGIEWILQFRILVAEQFERLIAEADGGDRDA